MTSETTLIWGIKKSLLEYVEGLEDGTVEVTAPATRTGGEFTFTLDEEASDFDPATRRGILQFRGSVVLTGYWGTMRVELTDPQLSVGEIATDLLVKTSSMFTGERFDPIASVAVTTFEPELLGTTRLTSAGRLLLGEQYQVGQELSDLRVTW